VTDDLVKRLREEVNDHMFGIIQSPLQLEAADRIEALEEAILQIANLEADPEFGTPPLETAKAIARKVL
jgi:hypothetical protein